MSHAKFSPSASSRWLNCTGSIHLTQDIIQTTSKYAVQGSTAHWLAEKCLRDEKLNPSDFVGVSVDNVGEYRLTQEDVDSVSEYIKFIRNEIAVFGGSLWVEYTFNPSLINRNFYGTCDAIIITDSGDLKIYDYKHGTGIVVSVYDNTQMLCYALLAVEHVKYLKLGTKIKSVEIVIVQPRASEEEFISRRFIDVAEFSEFKNKLIRTIREIESTKLSPILTAGEIQCRWCPAKPICPELRNKNLELAKAEFSDSAVKLPTIEDLTDEYLIKILDNADLFRSWLSSVEDYAESMALSGKNLPGYKLVRKRAYRKWSDEEKVKEYLSDKLDTNVLYTKRELRSPAQIETLLKKEDKKEIQKFIYAPQTELTLVKSSDRRPEETAYLSAKDEFN